MLWDANYTTPGAATTLSQLGGDLSVLGLKVTNVGGTTNAATTMVGFQNTGSANTLTIGSAGIDLGAARQVLTIQSKVLIGADQLWTISNANTATNPQGFNNGEDLAFNAQALGASLNFGSKTVTTAGAGQVTVTSGFALSNGTLNVGNNLFVVQGGASRLTTIANTLGIGIASGSILQFQSNSGAITSAAPITLNGGTLRLVTNNGTQGVTQSGNITVATPSTLQIGNSFTGGSSTGPLIFSGNLVGSAPLALNNIAANAGAVLQMSGTNSGYAGTITLGGTAGRSTRLTTSTAGSAAATWTIGTGHTLQVDGVSVNLGTLNGSGTITNQNAVNPATLNVGAGDFSGTITNGPAATALTKVGPGVLTLTGASSYSGNTSVNGGTLLVTAGAIVGSNVVVADGASFGVRVLSPGSTLLLPDLDVGQASAANLLFDAADGGNFLQPAITASNFNPLATTSLRLSGTNFTLNSAFPLISYGTIGGLGFNALNLVLPPRVSGALINNIGNNTIDARLTNIDLPRWTGAVSGNWDIDNGTGTGTTNWREVASGTATRYLETASGNDTVRFDDLATGTTTVNLTTTLKPNQVIVENSTVDYTFTGAGKISGNGGLTKSGSRKLILANTGVNDFTGTTTIEAGELVLGDGTTIGAGNLTGPIVNNAALVLNRPDDFTLVSAVSGPGALVKNLTNVATLSKVLTSSGAISLNAGTLRLQNGGALDGEILGAGNFEAAGGTVTLTGSAPNTHTGLTTVSAGILQLNKFGTGIQSVGGNVLITGAGTLQMLGSEQIPDSATITFTGTSADSTAGTTGMETVSNLVINPSVATGQFIMRNNFTVTGLARAVTGILGVASSHTAHVEAVELNPAAILRIAGNAGPSTLNVGAGGITASGGEIQVKFNNTIVDAYLNLGGDFTATGNVTITTPATVSPTGSEINLLGGQRNFNINAGTTTVGTPIRNGDLRKTGAGTLTLNAEEVLSSLITTAGVTNLNGALAVPQISNEGGILNINVTATGAALTVNGTTNLQVSQSLNSLNIGATGVATLSDGVPVPGAEFGAGAEAYVPLQAVPEPGALGLLATGVCMLLRRRRQR